MMQNKTPIKVVKSHEKLNLNIRSVIYEFFELKDLLKIATKISKRDKYVLCTQNQEAMKNRRHFIIHQKDTQNKTE
jgi:hypothetical protein